LWSTSDLESHVLAGKRSKVLDMIADAK